MKIKIKVYLSLRKIMDSQLVLEMEGKNITLGSVIEALSERYGKAFTNAVFDPKNSQINRNVSILLNGRHYTFLPHRLDTLLTEGDEISLFPPVAGG